MMPFSKTEGERKWLEKGYMHFAEYGPEKLSINKLSKAVASSRASFYHYFGDMEVFTEELLALHWKIAVNFNESGKNRCNRLFPDLYNLLAEHPLPLKFSTQLFRHRNNPAFNFLFIKTYEASAKSFTLKLFAKEYDLKQTESELYDLWLTVGETWYSRIDLQDLSAPSLQGHAKEILDTVIKFTQSQLYSSIEILSNV